jgi:hypothetical protein
MALRKRERCVGPTEASQIPWTRHTTEANNRKAVQIWVEIEQKFFGGDAVSFSGPTSTQAERL